MKAFKLLGALIALVYLATGCNPSDRNKKIGGSTDTSSVNRGGGPAIADTNTINAIRKQNRQDSLSGDTTYKGNASPDGRSPKK